MGSVEDVMWGTSTGSRAELADRIVTAREDDEEGRGLRFPSEGSVPQVVLE